MAAVDQHADVAELTQHGIAVLAGTECPRTGPALSLAPRARLVGGPQLHAWAVAPRVSSREPMLTVNMTTVEDWASTFDSTDEITGPSNQLPDRLSPDPPGW